MIKIPVVYKGKGEPPKYATSSAGMDFDNISSLS